MKQILTVFLCCLLFIGNAQPGFNTKTTPNLEAWRFVMGGTCDKNYYVAYNAKGSFLAKYSPSLTLAKSGPQKSPLNVKYDGLSGVVATDKTLSLLYSNLNVFYGGAMTVSKYVKQNFNTTTLEPQGAYTTMFDEKEDGFTGKEIAIAKSKNHQFTGVVITSKKDVEMCKVNLINGGAEVYNKKFSYKVDAPEVEIAKNTISISDKGDIAFMIADFSVHGDKAYLVCISAATQEIKVAPLKPGKAIFYSPELIFNKAGELVVCYGYSEKKNSTLVNGFMLEKYSQKLERLAQNDFVVTAKMVEQFNEVKDGAKDGAIYDLKTTKMHELENGHLVVIAEQIFNDFKNPNIAHSDAMVAMGFDENLKPTYQHYISKFQNRAPYVFFFGNGSEVIGNKVFIFHNGSNHPFRTEDGKIKFQCTWFEDGKTEPAKVLLNVPANGLFLDPKTITVGEAGKFVFSMTDLYLKKYAMTEVTVTDK